MKYFTKKLLGHEIFRSMISRLWSPGLRIFFEKFVKPCSRIIKSMKTQVSSFKCSSFPKIAIPKLVAHQCPLPLPCPILDI